MREPAQNPLSQNPLPPQSSVPQSASPFTPRAASPSPAAGFAAVNAVNSNAAAAYALSPKAAAALGLLFPWVGIPIGIVFLMLDDPRKAQLGWIAIGWSVAGTILSIVASLIVLGPLIAGLHSLLPTNPLHGAGGRGASPSLPGLGGDDDLQLFGAAFVWLLSRAAPGL